MKMFLALACAPAMQPYPSSYHMSSTDHKEPKSPDLSPLPENTKWILWLTNTDNAVHDPRTTSLTFIIQS